MILDIVGRLRPLSMDDVEFACLKTILLADPGESCFLFECLVSYSKVAQKGISLRCHCKA